jgi:hypothetical protein
MMEMRRIYKRKSNSKYQANLTSKRFQISGLQITSVETNTDLEA